jgi:hypothetical protein
MISPKWVSFIPQVYTNYTLETVPTPGISLMREKPDLVTDRIRNPSWAANRCQPDEAQK